MNTPNQNSGGGGQNNRGQGPRRDRPARSGSDGGNKRRRFKNKKGDGAPRREDARTAREPRPAREEDLSKPLPVKTHLKKRYGIVFYDNHAQARNDAARLGELKGTVDQLNIVIRAEGDMEDPELTQFGKVFAGAAWTLIHERRQADGWYDEPR